MKIAVNLQLAVQMMAFCEGSVAGREERHRARSCGGCDGSQRHRFAHDCVPRSFRLQQPEEAWFDVNMMQKDMLLAMELGRKLNVPLPTTAISNEFLTAARGMGWEKQDFAVVFDVLARMSGVAKMTTAAHPTKISEKTDLLLRMYRQMVAIRQFEAQVNELYTRALMPGLAHLYIGEEAVAVGVCEALERTDYITSTHRGHGHCLAKGASPDRMFAELLGKKAGYCKGKGGSMHIADPATGNLGANAIVCGSAGIATGAAFSARFYGTAAWPYVFSEKARSARAFSMK
jgi:hypothetical protein